MRFTSRRSTGVAFSLLGSVSFAVIYFYVTLLRGMDAEQIYGWRILFTAPVMALIVFMAGNWGEVIALGRRVVKRPLFLLYLLLSSSLLAVQLWMFMWAPLHGYGLDVSLGFFLLPIGLVLAGKYVFHEPLSKYQKYACFFAAIGVTNELLFAPRLSWPTFVILFGYTIYFVLRKKVKTDNLGGMWVDMLLSVPLALWCVTGHTNLQGGAVTLVILAQVAGLGLISAAGLGFMFAASHKLPLGLYGLLSYVEPVLLVGVALLLGERIASSQWITYLGIGIAISFLMYEGVISVRSVRSVSRDWNT